MTRYTRHAELRLTALDGEGVVLHLGSRKYYSVSESGLDLLEALTQPRTIEELVSTLTAKYDVGAEQAAASVRAFLEQGVRSGLLMTTETD